MTLKTLAKRRRNLSSIHFGGALPPLSLNLLRGRWRDRAAYTYWPEIQRICDAHEIL